MENKIKIISYQALINTGVVMISIEMTINGNTVRIDNIPVYETRLCEFSKEDNRNVWDENDIQSAIEEFFIQMTENIVI